MVRHPVLVPLSREHFSALAAAAHILAAGPEDDHAPLLQELQGLALDVHFAEEEQVLARHLPPDLAKLLLADHRDLRQLLARLQEPTASHNDWLVLANRLREHVRWEERMMFEVLTARLGTEGMAALRGLLRYADQVAATDLPRFGAE